MFLVLPDFFLTERFQTAIVQELNLINVRVPYIYDADGPILSVVHVYILELSFGIVDKPNSILQFPAVAVIYDSKHSMNKINNAFVQNYDDLYKLTTTLKNIARNAT